MEISCPHCFAIYPVNPEKIPDKGATPTCKKCGVAFTIVKATGDPVRDRAQRMKGYVLVRETNGEALYVEKQSDTGKHSRKSLKARTALKSKHIRLGACMAGVLLLLCAAILFFWKHQVHSEFERALKSSAIQASNKQFELNFEKVSFSWLGGLRRERGSIHGLSLIDLETRHSFKLADRIDFELTPSKKHFITKPFNIHMDGRFAKTVLKGCIVERTERDGPHVSLKADEFYSVLRGIELFTALHAEFAFRLNRDEQKENQRGSPVAGDIEFRAREIQVWSEPIIKRAEMLVSLKTGAVATLERCSLTILGAAVKATGRLEFQNPVERSDGSITVSGSNISPIMKYIHRVNEKAFDRIVTALVALEEQNAGAYNQGADSLELRISYNQSGIKINGQELQTLL